MLNYATAANILEPSDLAFLQKVFQTACDTQGIDNGSSAGSDLAARIINAYQHGLRSEEDLALHLRDFAQAS